MQAIKKIGILDYVLSLFFIIMWIIPICYLNFNRKDVPVADLLSKSTGIEKSNFDQTQLWLNEQYRIACLFTGSAGTWKHYFVQVKLKHNNSWMDVDNEDYSPMVPFGYRRRIERMYEESFYSGDDDANGIRLREDLSDFIRKRYATLNPGHQPLDSVRYIRALHKIGTPDMATPEGAFGFPKLSEIDPRKISIKSSHGFND